MDISFEEEVNVSKQTDEAQISEQIPCEENKEDSQQNDQAKHQKIKNVLIKKSSQDGAVNTDSSSSDPNLQKYGNDDSCEILRKEDNKEEVKIDSDKKEQKQEVCNHEEIIKDLNIQIKETENYSIILQEQFNTTKNAKIELEMKLQQINGEKADLQSQQTHLNNQFIYLQSQYSLLLNENNQIKNECADLKNKLKHFYEKEENESNMVLQKEQEKQLKKSKIISFGEMIKRTTIDDNKQKDMLQLKNPIQAISRKQIQKQPYIPNSKITTISDIKQISEKILTNRRVSLSQQKLFNFSQQSQADSNKEFNLYQQQDSINYTPRAMSQSAENGLNQFKEILERVYGQQKQFYFTPLTVNDIVCGENGEYKGNQLKQTKVLNLLKEENITHAGQVRGDGNCFFRSFTILYLKLKISLIQNDRSQLCEFFNILKSINIEEPRNYKEYFSMYNGQQLIYYAKVCLDESLNKILQSQNPLQQFIQELNSETFDFSLQLLTKTLLLMVFKESQFAQLLQDENSFKDDILDLNKEAGSDVLNILIEQLLNCQIFLLKCGRNGDCDIDWNKIDYNQELYIEKFKPFFLSQVQPKDGKPYIVYLWYKTGHYYYLLNESQVSVIQQSLQVQTKPQYDVFNQLMYQQKNYSYDQQSSFDSYQSEQLKKNDSIRNSKPNSQQNYNNNFNQVNNPNVNSNEQSPQIRQNVINQNQQYQNNVNSQGNIILQHIENGIHQNQNNRGFGSTQSLQNGYYQDQNNQQIQQQYNNQYLNQNYQNSQGKIIFQNGINQITNQVQVNGHSQQNLQNQFNLNQNQMNQARNSQQYYDTNQQFQQRQNDNQSDQQNNQQQNQFNFQNYQQNLNQNINNLQQNANQNYGNIYQQNQWLQQQNNCQNLQNNYAQNSYNDNQQQQFQNYQQVNMNNQQYQNYQQQQQQQMNTQHQNNQFGQNLNYNQFNNQIYQ